MADPDHHRRAYFDALYAADPDPWGFDTSPYEAEKYAATLAALGPGRRFRRAVEPGCANGALTERLAERCESLVAFDFVPEVAARARARLAGHPHVEVRTAAFPAYWPPGTGDLVVWSEVVYYLTEAGLERAIDGLGRWLEPGGLLVAVHWTGETDYPLSGDAVHERLRRTPFLEPVASRREMRYRLDAWRRAQTVSSP